MQQEHLTEPIISSAIHVHRALGPGLMESVYQKCLAHEFNKRGIDFEQQKLLSLMYDDEVVDCGYKVDFIVRKSVVVEIKSVETLLPVHHAQILTYMRLGGWQIGLLLNFNVALLKEGMRRFHLSPRYWR